jgi:hypothetical protein
VDLTQLMGKIDKKWGNLDDGGLGEIGGRRKRLLRHGEGRSAIDAIVKNATLTNRLPKKRVVNSKETRADP